MEQTRAEYYRQWSIRNRAKRSEYRRKWRKANPEKRHAQQERYRKHHRRQISEQRKRYRRANAEQIRTVQKIQRLRPASRFTSYKKRAKRLNVPFSLTFDEFSTLLHQPCHYCNVSPDPVGGIDRKIPSLGYVAENCVPCCWPCNWFKGKRGYDFFYSNISRIRSS